ncbi:MAG: hypothetical protein ACKO5K_00990 [Armatimonadota bacterium]
MTMRRAVGVLLRWLPPLVVAGCALVLAGPIGGYPETWAMLRRILDGLAPGHAPISDYGVTLYQLNEAVRRLAHALLACAVVVAVDRGPASRLPAARRIPVSILSAAGIAALAAGIRSLVETRHVRPEQWLPTLAGIVLGTAWIALGAGVRAAVRWSEDRSFERKAGESVHPPEAPSED